MQRKIARGVVLGTDAKKMPEVDDIPFDIRYMNFIRFGGKVSCSFQRVAMLPETLTGTIFSKSGSASKTSLIAKPQFVGERVVRCDNDGKRRLTKMLSMRSTWKHLIFWKWLFDTIMLIESWSNPLKTKR
jgi:hypothetical protein